LWPNDRQSIVAQWQAVEIESRLYTSEAELYDIAFSWDVSAEVEWILERLGKDCSPVLEPACGSGRMLAALAERGIEALGFDESPEMVRLARERLAGDLPGQALVGGMAGFDLGRIFGGAICPVDSLAHLSEPTDMPAHLACVARHLRPGSGYLIQLELRDPADPWRGVRPSVWEAERGDTCLRITWRVEQIDLDIGIEIQHARFEVTAGPDRGHALEERYRMAAWTPERWEAAIAESSFTYAAIYDGDRAERPRRPLGQTGRLLWHELRV
jgi:SAM-dependent methyltransferase